jgi:hypothetical protein
MSSILLVLVVLLAALILVPVVHHWRRSLVPQHGYGVSADMAVMHAQPRVRVVEVVATESDRVHIVLAPDGGGDDLRLDFTVSLQESDFGFNVLNEWRRSGAALAMVVPPGSHLLNLRSVDDLQPLTLRRVETD